MVRVMIVDDDKMARIGLEQMMPWKEYGMEVVAGAPNGARALDILRGETIDLAFVDLSMPIMTGLEFIAAAQALYPRMKFVVLTFHEDFAHVQEAIRLGVLDYISKLELESADYDAISKRISKRLGVKEEKEAATMPEWGDELLKLRWLYDSSLIDNLSTRTDADADTLRGVVMRVFFALENHFGLPTPPPPNPQNAAQLCACLKQTRETLFDAASNARDRSRLSVAVLWAAVYAERHLSERMTTDTIAAKAGLSRPYFSSSFAAETGLSFSQFLHRARIEAAKAKITQTPAISLSLLAQEVGYTDTRAFLKHFTEQTGQTPSVWKKSYSESH